MNSEWISVEQRPEEGSSVLVWIQSQEYGNRYGIIRNVTHGENWTDDPICEFDWSTKEITHWMPLPTPPCGLVTCDQEWP